MLDCQLEDQHSNPHEYRNCFRIMETFVPSSQLVCNEYIVHMVKQRDRQTDRGKAFDCPNILRLR